MAVHCNVPPKSENDLTVTESFRTNYFVIPKLVKQTNHHIVDDRVTISHFMLQVTD